MIDRRELLARRGRAGLRRRPPGLGRPGSGPPLEADLAGIAEELLADYPENATALGLDNGARAALKSPPHRPLARRPARVPRRAAARLARLRAIDRDALTPAARIDLDVVRTAHETRASKASLSLMATSPCSTRTGPIATRLMSWRRIPARSSRSPISLDSNHKVETAADAEAYLARLEAYAAALDGETERLAPRRGARRGRARFPARQEPAAAARGPRRSRSPNGAWSPRSPAAPLRCPATSAAAPRRLVTEKVAPALDRQIAELNATAPAPPPTPASGSCPTARLIMPGRCKAGTTTTRTPDEVHDRASSSSRALQARDGRPAARPGPDPGHGRRADDRARRGSAPPLPQHRRRPPRRCSPS